MIKSDINWLNGSHVQSISTLEYITSRWMIVEYKCTAIENAA